MSKRKLNSDPEIFNFNSVRAAPTQPPPIRALTVALRSTGWF